MIGIKTLLGSEKVRFLIAGVVNTAFGYGAFALLYFLLSTRFHYTIIILFSVFTNITFSFLTHKFYAFRARGSWIREYLRYYVVYSVPILFSFAGFSFCIEILHMNAYVTQAVLTAISTVMSYIGHKNFSFRKQGPAGNRA